MWPFRAKAATGQPSGYNSGGWRRILEPFAGAWQQGKSVSATDVSNYPTLFAVMDRVSSDIGKLPWHVKQRGADGVGRVVPCKLLERPNSFQIPSQFRAAWTLSLLQHGNAVVLKSPDLIVLDWNLVTPMVSPGGEVFYEVRTPDRSLLPSRFNGRSLAIPASEVMHDRRACLYHQLVGMPPLAAAYLPAAKNWHILDNSKTRFSKGNRLGGLLAVPAGLTEDGAKTLGTAWAETDPQTVRVLGMDAKFMPFDSKATDAQVVEQLSLSDRQICSPFHVPPFLVGAESLPSGQRPADYMLTYFQLALAHLIESMESLMTAGLGLPAGQSVKIDTSELWRMDQAGLGAFHTGLVKGGIETRNEARRAFDLPPVDGGDVITVQQQDVPLGSQANG